MGHLKVNGKLITEKKQIANLLASTISNNYSLQHYSPKFQAIKMQREKERERKKKPCEIRIRQHKNITNLSHF